MIVGCLDFPDSGYSPLLGCWIMGGTDDLELEAWVIRLWRGFKLEAWLIAFRGGLVGMFSLMWELHH